MTTTTEPVAQSDESTTDAPRPRRRISTSARRVILAIGLLVVWQLFVTLTGANKLTLPPPLDVLKALVGGLEDGSVVEATGATLRTLAIGTSVGMVIGLTLATLAVLSRWMEDLLGLAVAVMNPLPSIALLPLAMIWFGLTPTAIVVVILNSTVWPIALNASMGFRMLSPTLLRAARTMGIRGPRLVIQVLLPAALPNILTGLRIAWAFGWRTVVGAELIFGAAGGTHGLGFYINQARYFLETDVVFAGLIVISALGLAIELIFVMIEKRTVVRWGMTNTHSSN